MLPPGAEAVTGQRATAEQAEPLKDLISAMRKMLLAFALISVFVGSFIIFNTFAMLVAQRTRELALLRAVGASRAQVTRSVLGEAAGVAVAGSTLGIAAGLGLALGLARLMSLVAGEALPFGTPVVPGAALLASYGVGIPVTLAAAYVPARRAARIPPVAALRDAAATGRPLRARAVAGAVLAVAGLMAMGAGMLNDGKTALVLSGGGAAAFFVGVTVASPVISRPAAGLLGWPFARFGGAAGRMGRRNAQRDPRQTAATASALTIGLALIATVSVLTQSMSVSVDRQLEKGLTADYRITGRSRIVPVSPEALAAVARVPGVRTAVPIRDARLRLNGEVRPAMTGTPNQLAAHFHLSFPQATAAPARDLARAGAGRGRGRVACGAECGVGARVDGRQPRAGRVPGRCEGYVPRGRRVRRREGDRADRTADDRG
ncbi:FtsX-like permease family protein [Actinomadura sp. J1-007]|uniref:FtsX-like permease family protein n=1 Tax=Actinomadura sp. J1-007 TaxID=2661913 RepID=UPI00136817FC|nr:ABC transporter permease [Actinomadura sp. J1-007]